MDLDQEISELINKLNQKTGLSFQLSNEYPGGKEETITKLKKLVNEKPLSTRRKEFFNKVLFSEEESENLNNEALVLHINPNQQYFVLLTETAGTMPDETESIIKNLLHYPSNVYFLQAGSNRIIMLYPSSKKRLSETLFDLSRKITDTVSAEAMIKVNTSFSGTPRNIPDLKISYTEASMALKIGKIFDRKSHVYSYDNLGLARLVYELPEDVCLKYLAETWQNNTSPENFDKETLSIINTFLDTGLNIAETSRKLFMHRNTLVYRLDKIKRSTGLDLRNFNDAMNFKISAMIIEMLNQRY